MKISVLIYAFNLILLLTISLSAQSSIAILPFSCSGLPSEECKELTERFRSEISAQRKYTVLDRTSMESMLADQGFDLNEPCKESSCAVILGQLLAVDDIIMGTVGKINNTYIVNFKIVNISSGSQVKDVSGNHKVKKSVLINDILPSMALDLTSKDTSGVRIIKKKKKVLVPVTLITVGAAALAVPAYFIYKNYVKEEPETRKLEVQW